MENVVPIGVLNNQMQIDLRHLIEVLMNIGPNEAVDVVVVQNEMFLEITVTPVVAAASVAAGRTRRHRRRRRSNSWSNS